MINFFVTDTSVNRNEVIAFAINAMNNQNLIKHLLLHGHCVRSNNIYIIRYRHPHTVSENI